MFTLPVLLSPCPCTRPVRLVKSGLDGLLWPPLDILVCLLLDFLLLLLRRSFARTMRSVRFTSCALLGVLLDVILLPCPSSCARAVGLRKFCLCILVLVRCQPISHPDTEYAIACTATINARVHVAFCFLPLVRSLFDIRKQDERT